MQLWLESPKIQYINNSEINLPTNSTMITPGISSKFASILKLSGFLGLKFSSSAMAMVWTKDDLPRFQLFKSWKNCETSKDSLKRPPCYLSFLLTKVSRSAFVIEKSELQVGLLLLYSNVRHGRCSSTRQLQLELSFQNISSSLCFWRAKLEVVLIVANHLCTFFFGPINFRQYSKEDMWSQQTFQ